MLFYRCKGCGNFVTFLNDKTGCTPKCCGEPMVELTANTTDGALEKHVPVVKKVGNVVDVTVGSVEHPMLDNHYIEWIIVETEKGYQTRFLKPAEVPHATFTIPEDDAFVAAYEYCNLHGLWKAE